MSKEETKHGANTGVVYPPLSLLLDSLPINRCDSSGQFCIKSVEALHRQFRSRGGKKTFANISFSVSIYFFVCHKEYNASTSPLEGEKLHS